MICEQCGCEHAGKEEVCEQCVEGAMRRMEGQLGGRPTKEQIYRIFDMGGCGMAWVIESDQKRL